MLSTAFFLAQGISQPWPWNQTFLPGALVPSSGEWYLEARIWALSVLIIIGMSVPGPSVATAREYMYL